jgi:Zn finger protein HypA/HybF involved in hydrogenase expression
VPDDEDIKSTNYNLSKCDCGQEGVCDLCLSYNVKNNKLSCPVCSGNSFKLGKNRKFFLKEELEENDTDKNLS